MSSALTKPLTQEAWSTQVSSQALEQGCQVQAGVRPNGDPQPAVPPFPVIGVPQGAALAAVQLWAPGLPLGTGAGC